jgi:Lsr2
MAQKVEVTITSDISGEGGAHGVTLSLDGTATEIDLTEAEHVGLRDHLAIYFEKGRKAAAPKTGKRGSGRPKAATSATPAVAATGGSGLTKEDRQAVREYAAANGHELAKRGRLPELAITAWRDQNPEILSHLAA